MNFLNRRGFGHRDRVTLSICLPLNARSRLMESLWISQDLLMTVSLAWVFGSGRLASLK